MAQAATRITHQCRCALRHGLPRFLRSISVTLTVMMMANLSHAGALQVLVHDRDGKPLSNVVVIIDDEHEHPADKSRHGAASQPYVMDQINLQFVPQVLVVPVNASVNFPNSDTVSHQVYSFSKAKTFQLPLYKGMKHPPVTFDKPGLVVLGCNIHDQMIGYIYVTGASWFGQTNQQGSLIIDNIDDGKKEVSIWSPVIADNVKSLSRTVVVSAAETRVDFRLSKSLRSSPEPRPRNPDWDY
jgi:plastocyanin